MKLIFVYNADSGLFNTLADMGHKLFSPATYACSLCAITHGLFREKQQWKRFIESLGVETQFLHRNEFLSQHPDHAGKFPVVLLDSGKTLATCIDAEQLQSCSDLNQLIDLLHSRLDHARCPTKPTTD